MLNVKKVDYEKNPKFSLSKDLDNEEIILNSQNENRLVFDYLTFVSTQDTKEELISLLGLETLTFIQCKGFYGYSEQLFYEGIHIYFGGTSEMGVCVEILSILEQVIMKKFSVIFYAIQVLILLV